MKHSPAFPIVSAATRRPSLTHATQSSTGLARATSRCLSIRVHQCVVLSGFQGFAPSKGPSGCTKYPPPNFVCSATERFHRDLRLGRSLAYARGTAPPAVRLSPDTVLPLCNSLLPTSCSAANWLRERGRKGPTQQAQQTGPLFSSLVLVGEQQSSRCTLYIEFACGQALQLPGHSGTRVLPNPGREAPRTTFSLLNMAPPDN